MSHVSRAALILGAVILALGSPASGQNLLTNPGFESGLAGWVAFGNAFGEAANPPQFEPNSGNGLVSMFGNFSGGFNVTGVFQEFPANPNEVFEMNAVSRHWSGDPILGIGAANPTADNWVVMKIAFFDVTNTEIAGFETTILDGTFATDVQHTFAPVQGTAPAGTVKVQALLLYLQPAFAGGAGHVDDCEFTKISEWQVNQTCASLDIDGVQGTSAAPADVTIPEGQAAVLNINGTANAPWDIGVHVGGSLGVSASGGGITTAGGQIINLDVAAGPSFVNNLAFDIGLTPSSTPFALCTPTDASGQLFTLGPNFPDFTCWSGLTQLHVVAAPPCLPAALSLMLGDDAFAQVTLDPSASITFAGTNYNDFFVNSNGSASFGAGDASFQASVASFQSGPPKLAGMWSDLSPNVGGTVDVTGTGAVVTVSFVGVPEFGTGTGTLNGFDLSFDCCLGNVTISGYQPDPAHATDTLVGLSPGGAATDPGGVSFAGFVGMGAVPGAATDMVYEFASGAAVPGGWSSIDFPFGDGSSYTVN